MLHQKQPIPSDQSAPNLIAFFYLAEPFVDLKLKFSGNFTEATSNMQAAETQVRMWLAAKMKISEDRIAGLQLSPGKMIGILEASFYSSLIITEAHKAGLSPQ